MLQICHESWKFAQPKCLHKLYINFQPDLGHFIFATFFFLTGFKNEPIVHPRCFNSYGIKQFCHGHYHPSKLKRTTIKRCAYRKSCLSVEFDFRIRNESRALFDVHRMLLRYFLLFIDTILLCRSFLSERCLLFSMQFHTVNHKIQLCQLKLFSSSQYRALARKVASLNQSSSIHDTRAQYQSLGSISM